MILSWVVIFFIIAIIAGLFGFGGIAHDSAWVAKALFILFLALFLFTFLQDNGYIDTDFRVFSSDRTHLRH